MPGQDAARWGALPHWLEQARRATDQPIVLVIDAVNQLANAASALYQLQSVAWPEGVRVLASCTPELEVAPVWHIEPMPALDEAARRRFVTSYLGNFAKSVSTQMMQTLVTAPSCDNPLFLKLVLEELRLRATHESLATCMDELLRRAEPGALFLACLDGLDRDFASYTPQMGTRAARLLAASRRGLTHHELAELLTPPGQARVPDAVLLPLLANLQPYGEMHEGRLQLMHGILADALQARHPDVLVVRRQLMAYFSGGEPWEITEYAYQLLRAEFANTEASIKDMFIGNYDEQEVQNTFKGNIVAHTIYKSFQMNARVVENFSDLRVFLKVWEIDSNVTYNGLNFIGAGKPWQPSDFQDSLVDAWFSSIEPLTAGEVQVLRPEQLGAWLVESRFFFLAKAFLRRLIALQKLRLPDAGAACAIAAMNLADAHFKESEFNDAEALLWQALEHWQRAGLARSRPAIPTLCLLAATLMQLEDAARALPLQEQAIAIHMEGRTEADREACTMATPVALMNAALGHFDEARECALSTLEARRRLLGPMHPDVAETLVVLCEICVRESDMAGAERHLREAVQLLRATVSVGDPFLADFLTKLAILVAARGESAEAEELYDEARRSYQAKDPPFNPNVLSVLFQLSELQDARGDADSSQSSLEELIWLYDNLERVPPAQLFDAARAQVRLGALLTERGEVVQAAEHYSEAYALLKRIPEQEETQSLMTLAREGMGTPVPGPSFAVAGYGQVVQHPVVRYRLNIAGF